MDDQYILGEADGTASAMHWPTGLVWKRCSEGQTFESGQCTGTAQTKNWNAWAETDRLLPTSFNSQTYWGIEAGFSQNLLESGGWRMAYMNELQKITENCGNTPKINRSVFPDTPPSIVWSGSPTTSLMGASAISVNFNSGGASVRAPNESRNVRLVRGGQPFASLTSPAAQIVTQGNTVTFPSFPLSASLPAGQAWGGARISGDGNPEFQLNGTGDWVQQAIVKSGDQIAVRFNAADSGSRNVTFTLRSGQATGTRVSFMNEDTALQETSASFTALARRTDLSLQLPAGPHSGETLDLTVTSSEWHIDAAQSLTAASLATLPPRVTLPHGAVSLRLTNGAPGSNATVVLTYPEDLPAGTRYYKYGPTADNPADHWYAYPDAVISGNTITLTLTDGGAGDSDLSVNGIIADPGGPAWISAPGNVTAIPTLPQWAMMLLAGIMGMLALNRMRVRNT
jgi:hypothetical protein